MANVVSVSRMKLRCSEYAYVHVEDRENEAEVHPVRFTAPNYCASTVFARALVGKVMHRSLIRGSMFRSTSLSWRIR